MQTHKLTSKEIQQKISQLNKNLKQPWQIKNNLLNKKFVFKNFIAAFAFMSKVALLCEKADHHPDWDNSYQEVNINLITHQINALTNKDFDLAQKIEEVI